MDGWVKAGKFSFFVSAGAALLVMAASVSRFLDEAPGRVDAAVAREAALTRTAVADRLEAIEARLDRRIRIESGAYRAELRAARIDAARIAESQGDAYRAEVSRLIDDRLERMTRSVEEVAAIRGDVRPAIEGANLLMRRDALPAQLLGTLGATKVTMGRVAQMSIAVEKEVPAIVASAKGTAKSLEKTAESTERTAANVQKMTSPSLSGTLVRWMTEAVKTWGVWR